LSASRILPFFLLLLATPLVFYCAWPILRAAAVGFYNRQVRMETLLALGILAAYSLSAAQVIRGQTHLYFDTAAAIVRRKLTGRSVYCTDRGHLHHCLLRRGLSIRLALLVVSALCLVPVVGVLASVAWSNEALALVSAAAVIATLMLTRLFGHAELMLLHRRIVAVVASFLARPRGEARQDAVHLQGSADWGEFWSRLTECAARLDLRSLSLDVNAPAIQEGYNAVWSRGAGHDDAQDGEGLWRAEIPLRACGQTVGRVEVTGVSDGECVSSKIGAVAALVAEIEEAVCGLVVRRDAAPYRPAGHPHRNGALERASTT